VRVLLCVLPILGHHGRILRRRVGVPLRLDQPALWLQLPRILGNQLFEHPAQQRILLVEFQIPESSFGKLILENLSDLGLYFATGQYGGQLGKQSRAPLKPAR
jgi:hypothetical protein